MADLGETKRNYNMGEVEEIASVAIMLGKAVEEVKRFGYHTQKGLIERMLHYEEIFRPLTDELTLEDKRLRRDDLQLPL